MAKASLGYPTIKQAREVIRAIVDQYKVDEEFFHPLLQQLFIEQPYWCEPPGPKCTKFKWVWHKLPSGASTVRWFMAYCDESGWKGGGVVGWKGLSWRRAVELDKFNLDAELKVVARDRASVIVNEYRKAHPWCEYPDCGLEADHVHHVVPMKEIVAGGISLLDVSDRYRIQQTYDWWSEKQFTLPDEHKFMQHLLKYHGSEMLRSLCRTHHNDAHGKQTHSLKVKR